LRTFIFGGKSSTNYFKFISKIVKPYLPPVRVVSYKIPNRAGEIASKGNEVGSREIEITITLMGLSQVDLNTKIRLLSEFLIYDTDQELIFSDEPTLKYFARFNQESTNLEEIAYMGEGVLKFTCFDPFAYRTTENSVSVVSKDTTVTNNGSMKAYPWFDIFPNATSNFVKITNVTTGVYFYYNSPLTSGQELIVNNNTNQVYDLPNKTNKIINVTLESEFFSLIKGQNVIRFENQNADSSGLLGRATINWRERFY
jgi:predicted phage tail component-like protein